MEDLSCILNNSDISDLFNNEDRAKAIEEMETLEDEGKVKVNKEDEEDGKEKAKDL